MFNPSWTADFWNLTEQQLIVIVKPKISVPFSVIVDFLNLWCVSIQAALFSDRVYSVFVPQVRQWFDIA